MKKLYAEDTKLKQKQLQICPILSLQLDIFMLLVATLHRQPWNVEFKYNGHLVYVSSFKELDN